MKNTKDYYRLASTFYQCEELPENYRELNDGEFYKLLEANAWQPFEGYLGSDIAEMIDSLAITFKRVSADALS
jgi:heat shock protein HspQ